MANSRRILAEDELIKAFSKLQRVLLTNSKYKDLSPGAKLLYAVIRNDHNMKIEQGRANEDENGHLYSEATDFSLAFLLQVSEKTINTYKKELVKYELLEMVRPGLEQPNRLYLLEVEAGDAATWNTRYKQALEERKAAQEEKNRKRKEAAQKRKAAKKKKDPKPKKKPKTLVRRLNRKFYGSRNVIFTVHEQKNLPSLKKNQDLKEFKDRKNYKESIYLEKVQALNLPSMLINRLKEKDMIDGLIRLNINVLEIEDLFEETKDIDRHEFKRVLIDCITQTKEIKKTFKGLVRAAIENFKANKARKLSEGENADNGRNERYEASQNKMNQNRAEEEADPSAIDTEKQRQVKEYLAKKRKEKEEIYS